MRNPLVFVPLILLIIWGVWYLLSQNTVEAPINSSDNSVNKQVSPEKFVASSEKVEEKRVWAEPLTRTGERVTKKPFGIFIDPLTSPVQPERFRGYHTGTDFEIFPGEENEVVSVSSVCDGSLVEKTEASGYGGVVVERCKYENAPLLVVYGHLALSSVTAKVGDVLLKGKKIGELGAGDSADTDNERKHLHLGFYKGSKVNIRGYVATQAELSSWLDPCWYVCR